MKWWQTALLAKGAPIYAANMPEGLTLDEQDKWKSGLRPTVGMDCWSTADDGWREAMERRREFLCSEQERRDREPYGSHL